MQEGPSKSLNLLNYFVKSHASQLKAKLVLAFVMWWQWSWYGTMTPFLRTKPKKRWGDQHEVLVLVLLHSKPFQILMWPLSKNKGHFIKGPFNPTVEASLLPAFVLLENKDSICSLLVARNMLSTCNLAATK